MEMSLILAKQVFTMFIVVFAGFLMFKNKLITLDGNRSLGNVMIYLSLPCVTFRGFQVVRTAESVMHLAVSAAAAAMVLIITAIVVRICFKKDGIAAFAGTFSNPGGFAVPLILSCIGSEAVFFIAAYITMINIGQWTYGVFLLTGKPGSVSPKQIATAPVMFSAILGLFVFLTGFPVPTVLSKAVSTIADMNTPLGMFAIGVYLGQVDFRHAIGRIRNYQVSAVRLLVVPLIAVFALMIVPPQWNTIKMAVLIAGASPVGLNLSVYAQRHDCDYVYAVETIVVSTLFSIISMPIIVGLANYLW